jgi:hypothetical protein
MFFDKDFFKFMGAIIITCQLPEKRTLVMAERMLAMELLSKKVEEYNKIFSDLEKATQQRIIAREVQIIYADGGANSHLLRLFFVFFPETLAPIPMRL